MLLCARDAAISGLEVGGHHPQAHIISYGTRAKLVPSYQGLLALARRSGEVLNTAVGIVREGDELELPTDPLAPMLRHVESRAANRHEKPITYVWVGFALANGSRSYDWMSAGEAEAHGRRYAAKYDATDSPWQVNFSAMALKTVIRRHIGRGLVPISAELTHLIHSDEDGAHDQPTAYQQHLEQSHLDALAPEGRVPVH